MMMFTVEIEKNQELENVNILITCKDSEKANQLKSVDASDLYV